MHWTGGESGGVDYERELRLVEGPSADIYFLSAADTELTLADKIWRPSLGNSFRVVNAAALRQPVAADDFMERHAAKAKLVIIRLLGGESYYPHFIQSIRDSSLSVTRWIVLGGADQVDESLHRLSSFSSDDVSRIFELFRHGGENNFLSLGRWIQASWRGTPIPVPDVQPMPIFVEGESWSGYGNVWVIGYRAWAMASDMEIINALRDSLKTSELGGSIFTVASLRDAEVQKRLKECAANCAPSVILTLQSFAVSAHAEIQSDFLESFAVPVLQIPCSSLERSAWISGSGLPPAEVAMNVALPEIDGRVLVGVGGFKEPLPGVESGAIKRWSAERASLDFISRLSARWTRLQSTPNAEKRVALILSNYPNRDGRIGNGVGLDTPASVVLLLRRMREEGYHTGETLPENGDALIHWLQEGITVDPSSSYGRPSRQSVTADQVREWLQEFPSARLQEMEKHWGHVTEVEWEVPGMLLGNVFVGLQPPRGFTEQSSAIYHSPDLPPSPAYLAFYGWIREVFHADVMVEVGKHGNLEWLPGRATGMGVGDYSWHCLGPLPFLYSFIVNNPGEGTQAKRRCSAVIVDHLTPPLARAGLYGDLERAERLLEEHAHVSSLYPVRQSEIENEIQELLTSATWSEEFAGENPTLESLGSFLCELKESRIRSGLHILGEAPSGERQIDFIISLIRNPLPGRQGLGELIRQTLLITEDEANSIAARDRIDSAMRQWVESVLKDEKNSQETSELEGLRDFIKRVILSRLAECRFELDRLLDGMAGRFVPPGPAGSPTRGRLDVLPTGRNFYALDPRIVPTPTSWRCGKTMADRLLERHRQETGEYPKTVTMVVWGTSNMRTGGDDLAQALWLWGCEPVWEGESGRVIDFKILPVSLLGRPRVDVTLRVSGLFRDAFAETVKLLAAIPKRLSQLDESPEDNPLRASYLLDRETRVNFGASADEAERRAMARIFCSAPGAYGSGMLPLIDAGNWKTRGDLAEVFVRWGDHALHTDGTAEASGEELRERLKKTEVVHQNQDNREHDILDSDDYFQFQGGLHAAVSEIRGESPATYHGDSSDPDHLKVRTLREEFVRVLRSRVLNPRWMEAMRRHGYKGAFEMAATVDYIFGYDATCDLVEDHQYNEVAQRLLLDADQQAFFKKHNPHAFKESVERMLEAAERGLWQNPDPSTMDRLHGALLEIAGAME